MKYLGRLEHSEIVHAGESSLHASTQTSRAEFDPRCQSLFEFVMVTSSHELLDFSPCLWILSRALNIEKGRGALLLTYSVETEPFVDLSF